MTSFVAALCGQPYQGSVLLANFDHFLGVTGDEYMLATDDYFNNCVFTSIASLPQGIKLANVPSLQ